jgi:alkylhydroperoxidase family enzyme
VIARPREPKGTPRQRALIEVATLVTEQPWRVRRVAELDDEAFVHTIALSAYFGHLNRIADAVAVPLDFAVRHAPPATDPHVPALAPAPAPATCDPALSLAVRPATATAFGAWYEYVFDRDAPLSRAERSQITGWISDWLGAPRYAAEDGVVDPDLRHLAELVTLAPWQLSDAAYAPLRGRGWNDEKLFDAVVTASTAGMASRLHVAFAAIG